MSNNLIIRGTTYPNVPDISVKNADDQTKEVIYRDTSDATLSSGGQMLNGVEGYGPSGKVTGSIPEKTASDLTASGATVSVPAGHYASPASKSIPSGSAATPATTIQATPTLTIDTTTGEVSAAVNASQSVTPTVAPGYVQAGTAGTVSARFFRACPPPVPV